MDYEKKYNEAIEKMRKMLRPWSELAYNGKTFLQDLKDIFPELRESEDDRIRKAIIELLKEIEEDESYTGRQHIPDMLAYLEKQKEQKPILQEDIQKGQAVSLPKDIEAAYQHGLDVGKRMDMDKYCLRSEKWKEVEETAKNEFNKGYEQGLKEGIKSVKWSEEDETRLTNIIIMLKEYLIHHYSKDDIDKSVAWLKSLRPSWKPSEQDELMKLKYAGTSTKLD